MKSNKITIRGEYIRLCDLLKFAALCATGGEAKLAVSEGLVRVDGQVCDIKGKKIIPGQRVSYNGEEIEVCGEA